MLKIDIRGAIVSNDVKWIYEWFEIEATCPRDIENSLEEAAGQEVEIIINSGGGSVYAGSEIYTSIKGYTGKTLGKIPSVAASAASVAAMGVDVLEISPTAQIMVHNVSSTVQGDYRDLSHEANVIKNYNTSIANSYILRTGLPKSEILAMMDKETWLNAQQAKEKGFVDAIMFDESHQLVASVMSNNQPLSKEIIDKMRNEKKNLVPIGEKDDKLEIRRAVSDLEKPDLLKLNQAKLNLLKLGETK